MKTSIGVVFGLLSIFSVAPADDKKAMLTFLDTLNKGKELSITNADFPPQGDPVATETPVAAPVEPADDPSVTAPKKEAGVVASLFRIQVLASTRQEQVKKESAALASKISIPVSVSFETPYYKLFAGEFSERTEAENYLAQVRKLGYNDAWISRIAALKK